MRRVLVVTTALFIVGVLAVRVWAAAPLKTMQGYWMGVDPVDGGDQRRSFVQQEDGSIFALGRDSFLRLCDHSDRAVISFDDARLVSKRVVATDNFTLTCLNSGAVVLLKARYELIDDSLMIEHITTQEGAGVQTMPLHRVSR
jgi:hypothetical protein